MRSSEERRIPSYSSDCAGGAAAAEVPRDATAWMLGEIQGRVAKGFSKVERSGVPDAGREARGFAIALAFGLRAGVCGLAFFADVAARAGASAGTGAY